MKISIYTSVIPMYRGPKRLLTPCGTLVRGSLIELSGNIIQHRSWWRFARHERATGITHQTELHRKAELVVVTPAKLDFQSICRRQRIMSHQAFIICRDVEKLTTILNFEKRPFRPLNIKGHLWMPRGMQEESWVGIAARSRVLTSVRPLVRPFICRGPVWEFADRSQNTDARS